MHENQRPQSPDCSGMGERNATVHRAGRHAFRCRWVALAAMALLSTGCGSVQQWWDNGFRVGPEYGRPPAPIADEGIENGRPGP